MTKQKIRPLERTKAEKLAQTQKASTIIAKRRSARAPARSLRAHPTSQTLALRRAQTIDRKEQHQLRVPSSCEGSVHTHLRQEATSHQLRPSREESSSESRFSPARKRRNHRMLVAQILRPEPTSHEATLARTVETYSRVPGLIPDGRVLVNFRSFQGRTWELLLTEPSSYSCPKAELWQLSANSTQTQTGQPPG